MVRNIVTFFVCFHSVLLIAQTDYIRPGLLKATASISPALMLNHDVQNIYLTGFFEAHSDKRISLRGDAMWYVDGKRSSGDLIFDRGIRLFYGAFAHLNKSNWDVHFGLQPGLTVVQPHVSLNPNRTLQAVPSVAVHLGTTYYVWKIFHFYFDVSYVKSTLRGLTVGSLATDELLFSAGLGLHINTIKPKKNLSIE